jgi:hypothetical protein
MNIKNKFTFYLGLLLQNSTTRKVALKNLKFILRKTSSTSPSLQVREAEK